ncbi:LacI family DNA-binding transcriptional regulator [Tropicibacter sp. Alg240-R139]|uniref:LacI family DNA-binding transcriptional regulator n=1 Tax=Tropicibacter sp. Alg240-R139 TaxID=2305991 RepID=UPI0013DEF748|nr:LacI family DNA-binding transcriptional regulator [Tropicibacter sp. Alg240-R139]
MGKSRTAPTLNDVAKEAGVSTATVSRCLNSPARVVEETRKRVLSAVDKLGYTPNMAARTMAANRSYSIGAIIPTMDNAIFARGLQAFQDHLREKGYSLLVASSAYHPDVEKDQIRTLVARGVDGLLLIGHAREDEIYDYLEQHQVPALVAWSYLPEARQPSVGFNNRGAMCDLARSVLAAGHRRIGLISGVTQGNDRALSRVDGARDALAEAGMEPQALTVIETPYGIDNGAQAFAELMRREPRPTAVMCGNDVLAVGALREATRVGISVPGEISITGFDDIELADIITPSLTTVHVPHREMGQKAASELIDMVEGRSAGRSTCIRTHIVSRASLAFSKT